MKINTISVSGKMKITELGTGKGRQTKINRRPLTRRYESSSERPTLFNNKSGRRS